LLQENPTPDLPEINTHYLLDFLSKLLNTPSPTGFAEPAIVLCEQTLKEFPALTLARTRLDRWPVFPLLAILLAVLLIPSSVLP